MNNTFSLIQETDGVTIIENGAEKYFTSGVALASDFSINGNTITIKISIYTYKVSLSDSITIGDTLFAGTFSQLKTALKMVFPKAAASALTTADLEFTDFSKGPILRTSDGTRVRLTAIKNDDNTISLNLSNPL